jgi:hypothetical protein
MPWRDVWLTLQGIQMKESPFRALGQIMVDIWAGKPVDLKNSWKIPFDGPSEHQSTFERLKQIKKQWQQKNLK